MARYCSALDVFDELNAVTARSDDFTSVGSGDTVELTTSGEYIIPNAFTTEENSELSADQDVIVLDGSDTVQSTSDYDVDKRDGEVTWNGTGGTDLTIRFKTSPVPADVINDKIAEMSAYIDERTNTTFNGTVSVTDELLNGSGFATEFYPLRGRPVRSIDELEVNAADVGKSDDWKTRTEGRSEDFVSNRLGFQWVEPETHPDDSLANIRVDYTYGHSDVPDSIRRLAKLLTLVELDKSSVSAALFEGRDNFDPEQVDNFKSEIPELFSEWIEEDFGGHAEYLHEVGSES